MQNRNSCYWLGLNYTGFLNPDLLNPLWLSLHHSQSFKHGLQTTVTGFTQHAIQNQGITTAYEVSLWCSS